MLQPAHHALHFTCSHFCASHRERNVPSQRALGFGEPALRRITIAVEQAESAREDSRGSQQPIRFVLVESALRVCGG